MITVLNVRQVGSIHLNRGEVGFLLYGPLRDFMESRGSGEHDLLSKITFRKFTSGDTVHTANDSREICFRTFNDMILTAK